MRPSTIVLALGALVTGCRTSEEVCSRPGEVGAVLVLVQDSLTGAPRGLGARLIIQDGAYADTAMGVLADLALAAGLETASSGVREPRAGTYEVSVSAPGYLTWRRSAVRVNRDRCGVVPTRLLARLAR